MWWCVASTLLACGPPDAGSELDGGVTDGGADAVPMLDEALPCSPTPDTGVAEGDDLVRVTLSDPRAVCNDGTPAVMYVRRAASPDQEDRWVFHLQGGGACGGPDCAARWCGRNSKMTTAGAPSSMGGVGLMRRGPENALGDANQVFLYYCSSDNWAGRAPDAVVAAEGDVPRFRLHFQGDAIVDAALDALEEGASSDDGAVTLPALGGGGTALWTGTSGGCQGVANTADRFAARMRALGVSPALVCDANFGPTDSELPAGAALDALLAGRRARFDLTERYSNTNHDESCVAMHPTDPWRCEWSGYVLANHVTEAPLFLRMSLADRAISDSYVAAGFDLDAFATGVQSALSTAAAGGGLESTARPISVYGPGCEQHVGLTNDDWFFSASMTADGAEVTFHDAVVRWLAGDDVAVVDTVPPTISTCAPVTDQTD